MTGLVFPILFGLNFLLFPSCEGKISLTVEEDIIVVLPGEDVEMAWKISGIKISDLSIRQWFFLPENTLLAQIIGDGAVVIRNTNFASRIEIKKPSTLVLKNVDNNFNGTYQLILSVGSNESKSDVSVFVAVTPMVTVECSSPTTVNIGDTFTCVCKGQGGNPPADVMWFKGNEQKGGTGKEEQILRLPNVNKEDSGTYRCEAKSHEDAKNVTEIEIIVNYPPENVKLMLTRSGKSATIKCTAEARPPASFKIFLNQTKLVKSDQMLTISEVNRSHVGYYTCVAWNILGGKTSNSEYLSSEGPLATHPTTTTSSQKTTTKGNETDKASSNNTSCGTEWYIVVVSVVSGIIIGILLSYIVSCSRRKFRGRKPQSKPEPKTTEVDTTYQELDLTKMNTEDNYQSLRVNAASNDDDSTYTELNKTRDVENNYQSLT